MDPSAMFQMQAAPRDVPVAMRVPPALMLQADTPGGRAGDDCRADGGAPSDTSHG